MPQVAVKTNQDLRSSTQRNWGGFNCNHREKETEVIVGFKPEKGRLCGRVFSERNTAAQAPYEILSYQKIIIAVVVKISSADSNSRQSRSCPLRIFCFLMRENASVPGGTGCFFNRVNV